MASYAPMTAAERQRLHREWMERSERAFQRMFAEDQQEGLVTFTQREDRAVDLGQELAKWLVEEHIAADPAAQPSQHREQEAPPPCCPKCGRAGVAVTEPRDPCRGGNCSAGPGRSGWSVSSTRVRP